MALDINGYNAAFKAFTDFAQQKMDAGETKAVARGEVQNKVFDGRVIKAATTDKAYAFTRSADEKYFNEVAREQFKRAIIDMFGGESNIPESVRKAMLLGDYGSGKPLTARRIMAVKNAIDADGTARARSADARQREFDASISKFSSPEVEAAALAKGYSKAELPRLAAAANLYVKVTHCSEADALAEVTTLGSKANRLMNYGGRFLKSAENFANGLRLLDAYSTWFDETEAVLKNIGFSDNFVDGMSKTVLNASLSSINAGDKRGIEKFVFEELAYNSSVNLAEADSEKVFGMQNNAAMRFIGRGYHNAKSQTLGQIPPERRPAFFAAFDLLTPLFAATANEAKIRPALRHEIKDCDTGYLTGRILKNFDKIEELLRLGQLDAKGLVKLCFPEIKKVGDDPIGAFNKLTKQWLKDTSDDPMTGAPSRIPSQYYGQIMMMQEVTGCGIDDAYEAVLGRKQIPLVPYASNGTLGIDSFDGTTTAARKQLVADLDRPTNYSIVGGQQDILGEGFGFRFNFPDGQTLLTNGFEDGRANIKTVCDKVETFCGKMHAAQASSVMMMMSQSGLAPLRNGLLPFGIDSSEHAACDFTLSKNADTGDITIRYSSPKELPFAFEWTATIKPDGQTTTTPLRFIDEAKMAAVRNAVDVAKTAFIDAKSATVNNVGEARLAENIEIAMKAVAGDADAMGVLCDASVIDEVLFNSNNQLRSPDEIARKALLVKANVEELRQATQGDKAMFDAGIKALPFFAGKTLPPGIIADLVRAVKAAKLDSVTGLNANSGVVDIHNAVHQIVRTTVQMTATAHILDSLHDLGEDGSAAVKNLISSFLFARIPANRLPTIRDALSSANATRLRSVYGYIGDYENEGAINDALKNKTKYMNVVRSAIVSLDLLERLRQNIAESLGEAFKLLGNFNGDMFEDDGVKRGFTPAIRDIEKLVTDFNVKI